MVKPLSALTSHEWQFRKPHCRINEVLDTLTNHFHSGFLEHQIETNEHAEFHSKICVESDQLRFQSGPHKRFIEQMEFPVAFE